MMRILIYIFLICHFNFLKCIDLPKSLKCADDSCTEQISTGRVIKPTNSIHGNLGLVKASSKVKIRGKNDTPENTLWLIEQEEEYGFIDLTFIKENTKNVNKALMTVKNPYYVKTIDETEDDEDSTNETKLFSKGRSIKTNDISVENDDTENYSEQNHKLNKETEKVTDINSETDAASSSSTHEVSDLLKSDSDFTNINPLINKKSELVNSEIDKSKNAFEQDTKLMNSKEDPQSISSINTLDGKKEKITESIKNVELRKNDIQEGKDVIQSKENVKFEIPKDKNGEIQNFNLQNKDIKHKEINESTKIISQNQDFEKEDLINKQANLKNDIDGTVINRKNYSNSNGNVSENAQTSQVPIETTEIHAGTQENNKGDLKSENVVSDIKLTNISTGSKTIENQLSNETLKNIKTDEQKNLNSVKPNKSPQIYVDKPPIKDNTELQSDKRNNHENIDSPVEKLIEKKEETQLKDNINVNTDQNNISNNLKNDEKPSDYFQNDSKSGEIENKNKKLTKISPEDDNSKINQNPKPDMEVENSKNSENIPKESIKSLNIDSESDPVHSKQDEKLTKENMEKINISVINQENISKSDRSDEEKLHEKLENVIIKSIESNFLEKHDNSKQPDKEQVEKNKDLLFETDKQSKILAEKTSEPIIPGTIEKSSENRDKMPVKESRNDPIRSDPWFSNNGKSSLDNEKEMINHIRSPFIKLILKLDHISQIIIKSITLKLGFDSSSKFSQFTNYWLQMSLENFVSIFLLFSVMFLVVYTPKLLKFNRDWKSEFLKQSQLIKELELKLSNIEEVRHKLTVQNHNFEKVIDEYKEKINEIQEDSVKNKKTLLLEVDKIKKINESSIKNVNMDLANKIQQCQILENDIVNKTAIIDNLEEEKKQMEISMENDKSQLEMKLLENKQDLNRMLVSNEQLESKSRQLSSENHELKDNLRELNLDLLDKIEALSQLENSFEHLKLFEGLNFEEYNEKKAIYLDLTNTKQQLELAEQNIGKLNRELNTKSDLLIRLEQDKSEMSRKMMDYENEKAEAVTRKDAAEMKLNVLSEYFKSKEVEMARTLGHQVIESTQSMDQVDYLKHRIQILETENEEMSKTIQKLKAEVKEAQIFAAKCKSDANEEINKLFIKCTNLERSVLTETDENKKLRIKLSRYCGPTPPRNQSSTFNHNTKDRPPSRQSGFSDSVGTFAPLPFIPFSPQSPTTPNNSQFSGRNSVNSKKSNNT